MANSKMDRNQDLELKEWKMLLIEVSFRRTVEQVKEDWNKMVEISSMDSSARVF